tara:strand:+ start:277 stop:396 length:120 start_codon:yes stop_codon:yes gene_type:complete
MSGFLKSYGASDPCLFVIPAKAGIQPCARRGNELNLEYL